MNYSLSAISSLIIDEADRLFELGFAEQLTEILHRVPATRQTLLFSATLPSSLVGFAKAGLQNPKLIRLDVDQKISKDLRMAYLNVKSTEKEAVLLGLLREVIRVPVMSEEQRSAEHARVARENEAVMKGTDSGTSNHYDYTSTGDRRGGGGGGFKGKGRMQDRGKKRKRGGGDDDDEEELDLDSVNGANIAPHQTVVFVSTKHHVEYITGLLTAANYSVSPIYGSMDQTARKISLSRFRSGQTSILVVTDLAARGIDVPGVENVINYDFPNGTRAFVHRVGRTARAGRTGWAYTFVTANDLPYLFDLELFLSRPLNFCPLSSSSAADPSSSADATGEPDYAHTLILGAPPRLLTDTDIETHRSLVEHHPHLEQLQQVSQRGQRMYERGLGKASPESYRRAKEMAREKVEKAAKTGGVITEAGEEHPIYDEYLASALGRGVGGATTAGGEEDVRAVAERAKAVERSRAELLAKIGGFRPNETVLEVNAKGKNGASEGSVANLMKERRKALLRSERARQLTKKVDEEELPEVPEGAAAGEDSATGQMDVDDEVAKVEQPRAPLRTEMDEADEEELEVGLKSLLPAPVVYGLSRILTCRVLPCPIREQAVFGKKPAKRAKPAGDKPSWRDERFFMGYEQEGAATEAG